MIYYKIRKIRQLINLTVDYMAEELELSVRTYIAIENGEVDVKLSKLFTIAEILGITIRDLFCFTEIKLRTNEPYNLYDYTGEKTLKYTSFSDKYVDRYILRLEIQNKILAKNSA
jgi:transcriptional regulator with XRE-family HTH domain